MNYILRDCPFCGKHEAEIIKEFDHESAYTRYIVRCSWCSARGEECDSREWAAKVWNKPRHHEVTK
jgi:Lar family restriction alleviation protein